MSPVGICDWQAEHLSVKQSLAQSLFRWRAIARSVEIALVTRSVNCKCLGIQEIKKSKVYFLFIHLANEFAFLQVSPALIANIALAIKGNCSLYHSQFYQSHGNALRKVQRNKMYHPQQLFRNLSRYGEPKQEKLSFFKFST